MDPPESPSPRNRSLDPPLGSSQPSNPSTSPRGGFGHPEAGSSPGQSAAVDREEEKKCRKAVGKYPLWLRSIVVEELLNLNIQWESLSWKDRQLAVKEYKRATNLRKEPDFSFLKGASEPTAESERDG